MILCVEKLFGLCMTKTSEKWLFERVKRMDWVVFVGLASKDSKQRSDITPENKTTFNSTFDQPSLLVFLGINNIVKLACGKEMSPILSSLT